MTLVYNQKSKPGEGNLRTKMSRASMTLGEAPLSVTAMSLYDRKVPRKMLIGYEAISDNKQFDRTHHPVRIRAH